MCNVPAFFFICVAELLVARIGRKIAARTASAELKTQRHAIIINKARQNRKRFSILGEPADTDILIPSATGRAAREVLTCEHLQAELDLAVGGG